MYIQTDDTGKIVAAIDQEWLDTLPNDEKSAVTEGFEKIGATDVFREGYDTYYINGELTYVDNNQDALIHIAQLKIKLQDTDYISAKMADKLATCLSSEEVNKVLADFNAQYSDILEQRQQWRDEINILEAQLAAVANE